MPPTRANCLKYMRCLQPLTRVFGIAAVAFIPTVAFAAPKPSEPLISTKRLLSGGATSALSYREYCFPTWAPDQIPVEIRAEKAVVEMKLTAISEWTRVDRVKMGIPREAAADPVQIDDFMGVPILARAGLWRRVPEQMSHPYAGVFSMGNELYFSSITGKPPAKTPSPFRGKRPRAKASRSSSTRSIPKPSICLARLIH